MQIRPPAGRKASESVESGTNYSHAVGYTYDLENNLTSLVETINGVDYTTSYTYDEDNRLASVIFGDSSKEYSYDGYGRSHQQVTKDGQTTVKTDSFTFTAPSTTTSSAQISGHSIVSSGVNKTYTYTYDDNGNILSISDGTNTVSYVYDKANQLVRENNQGGNFTHTWTYDDAGNILTRNEYAYTTGSLEGITPTDTVAYTYGDADWGDLLTAYDGQTITYDTIGNPLTQTDSEGNTVRSFQWQHGRQLAAMTVGGQTWTYTYNADGLRTSKSNGTATYQYIYDGSKLTQMVCGSNTLHFSYDAAGTPLTVTYNGTVFYYITNVQGDVVGIMNSAGQQVVSYSYDAWGNLLSTGGSLADTLGILNPLRYRGYVYDSETGLYYVSSRYYDPEIGRWINADEIISFNDVLGANLFAYCDNDPVNKVDYSGQDGQNIELGKGWYYRIDPQNTATGTKRHIHIWNSKEEYIQNDDGSPHDKHRGGRGGIPKWLNKKLIEKAGWDYNENRTSFFEGTEYVYTDLGIQYTFLDGTKVLRPINYFVPFESESTFEKAYFEGSITPGTTQNSTQTFYLPIIGPITFPAFSFSFGFGWGLFPVPFFI